MEYTDLYKGESLASIVESFVRASDVIVTKSLTTPTGAYMLLQGSMYARIGMILENQIWR
jgi:anaphase-promoting complex subunit 5